MTNGGAPGFTPAPRHLQGSAQGLLLPVCAELQRLEGTSAQVGCLPIDGPLGAQSA